MDGFYLGCCNSSASQAIISWGRQRETPNPTQTNIQKENLSYKEYPENPVTSVRG